ncbi:hypothetical protein T06_2475 [Trichinella sp. T6]|nr:hypothetical protein T06_2475 [Trichinella sp. T6]
MKINRVSQPQALPSGYARGQIKICICLQAIPQAIYSTIFDLRGPRRRLRLCPRANKNLHIPAGYAESILVHNQGDMQIFICIQATPRAFPQVSNLRQVPHFCNSILTSSLSIILIFSTYLNMLSTA